jgi:hypothetical protein
MGARGRACPVCNNPDIMPVVTAMLEGGSTYRAIAERTSLSRDQVARHKRHASQPTALPDEPGSELEMSDQRLSRWLERSEAAWVAASAQGDIKGAIDALRSGVRSELEHRRRLEARTEQTSTDENLPFNHRPITIEVIDQIVRTSERDDELKGVTLCPRCIGRGRIPIAKATS